eukprot:scaffold48_cov311-Pinguiococcus_pyrenoidosus.AAC.258
MAKRHECRSRPADQSGEAETFGNEQGSHAVAQGRALRARFPLSRPPLRSAPARREEAFRLSRPNSEDPFELDERRASGEEHPGQPRSRASPQKFLCARTSSASQRCPAQTWRGGGSWVAAASDASAPSPRRMRSVLATRPLCPRTASGCGGWRRTRRCRTCPMRPSLSHRRRIRGKAGARARLRSAGAAAGVLRSAPRSRSRGADDRPSGSASRC